MTLAVACGCQTEKKKKSEAKKDVVAALRIHVQADPSVGGSDTVSVLRSTPVSVAVGHDPVLTEANVNTAEVIDTPGGFAVEVHFDDTGALMLEQYSAANPGRHFVIFGQWGDKLVNGRWLAAPLITRRISNGVLAFTPDITRQEAEQLVLGLNNVSIKVHKSIFDK
ncbi:MAG: hypothetical protein WDN00_08175 [Limisphaerales bacterium]